MATVIMMPRLSPTMEEGVLLKWSKKEGEHVSPGEVIAEVETDKANMDFPLEDEGTLLKLLVSEGDTVKLGAPVAVLGEPGEDVAGVLAEAGVSGAPPTAPPPEAAAPAPPPKEEEAPAPQPPTRAEAAKALETRGDGQGAAILGTDLGAAQTRILADRDQGQTEPRTVEAAIPAISLHPTERAPRRAVRASPLARKLAYERGVDLRQVVGTGPGGRVIKRDVESARARPAPAPPIARPAVPPPIAPPIAPPLAPGAGDQVQPLSPMRRTIARRLTESKATVPHFYVTMDAHVDALWTFHEQLKANSEAKITLNDLVLKAVAAALRRVPEANVSWSEEGLVRHAGVHLGIAVSIEDGLVTPVLRDADRKSVGTIAAEARDLIERARARKLRGDEFTGSTFSVSNMGMFGVKSFSAVINPPEAGILAVGAVDKRPVVVSGPDREDRFEARRMTTLTLSADHRAVDGALAARLLGTIVQLLERPFALVL